MTQPGLEQIWQDGEGARVDWEGKVIQTLNSAFHYFGRQRNDLSPRWALMPSFV